MEINNLISLINCINNIHKNVCIYDKIVSGQEFPHKWPGITPSLG